MTELFTWLTGFATFEIATIGTTAVTVGLITAYGMIGTLAFMLLKRAKGRG